MLLLASFAIPQCASMPYSLRALRRALKDEPAPALVRRQAPPPLISWSRISFHGSALRPFFHALPPLPLTTVRYSCRRKQHALLQWWRR